MRMSNTPDTGPSYTKKNTPLFGGVFFLVAATGIEPVTSSL